MRAPTLLVCILVLTAGCMGNVGGPVQPGGAEETKTRESTLPHQPKTPSSAEYDVNIKKIENIIHEKLNKRRQEHNLEPLSRNKSLDAVARYKSWDMARRDYFAHTGPNGTTHTNLRSKFAVDCVYSGQNIYKDHWAENKQNVHLALTNSNEIASAAVRLLLNSPGHRENALSADYDSQGIGVFVDENGTVFVTQELCG